MEEGSGQPWVVGFPDSSAGKESACNVGDQGLIPGLGRSPGDGKGYPLQYSGLENSMDYTVYGVAKSRTELSLSHTEQIGGFRFAWYKRLSSRALTSITPQKFPSHSHRDQLGRLKEMQILGPTTSIASDFWVWVL